MSYPPNQPFMRNDPEGGDQSQPWGSAPGQSDAPESAGAQPWQPTQPMPSSEWQQPAGTWQPQQPGAVPPSPYGAQPGWQPGQPPPGAWGAPPPANKSRVGLVIGAVAASLVVIIVVAVILVGRSAAREQEAEEQASQARIDGVTAAVQGAFDAIVAGDAATALTFVEADGDTTFLTDDVLAVSNEIAPISEVVVTPPSSVDEYYASVDVDVSFMLGDEQVGQTYTVNDFDDDGTWLISDLVGHGYYFDSSDGLEVALNGVPVTTEDFLLFPGSYRFTTASEYFTLGDDAAFTVTDPFMVDIPLLEPELTDEGLAAFQDAVQTAVDGCVSSKDLETGCGLSLPAKLDDGTKLKDGTVKRTLSSDAVRALEDLEVTYLNGSVVVGDYIGAVDVEVGCTADGQSGTCEIFFAPSLGAPSVDMTDPDLEVLWD